MIKIEHDTEHDTEQEALIPIPVVHLIRAGTHTWRCINTECDGEHHYCVLAA